MKKFGPERRFQQLELLKFSLIRDVKNFVMKNRLHVKSKGIGRLKKYEVKSKVI